MKEESRQLRRSVYVSASIKSLYFTFCRCTHTNRVFCFFFTLEPHEHRPETWSARGGLNDSGEAAQGPERAGDYRYLLCLRRSGHARRAGAKFLPASD